jgi:hypothetical protein
MPFFVTKVGDMHHKIIQLISKVTLRDLVFHTFYRIDNISKVVCTENTNTQSTINNYDNSNSTVNYNDLNLS